MMPPDPIVALRVLATNAESLVQMLRTTGRAPACFELTGLAEAQRTLQLLDALPPAAAPGPGRDPCS